MFQHTFDIFLTETIHNFTHCLIVEDPFQVSDGTGFILIFGCYIFSQFRNEVLSEDWLLGLIRRLISHNRFLLLYFLRFFCFHIAWHIVNDLINFLDDFLFAHFFLNKFKSTWSQKKYLSVSVWNLSTYVLDLLGTASNTASWANTMRSNSYIFDSSSIHLKWVS